MMARQLGRCDVDGIERTQTVGADDVERCGVDVGRVGGDHRDQAVVEVVIDTIENRLDGDDSARSRRPHDESAFVSRDAAQADAAASLGLNVG